MGKVGVQMSKVIRKRPDTGIYHIMLRGVDSQNIFTEDEDYKKFLNMLWYIC